MIYDVRHKTTFVYEEVVSVSHHVLHLAPRSLPRQRCLETSIVIDPVPSIGSTGEDYFGNPVRYLTVQEPHERLVVEAYARVEVDAPPELGDLAASPTWESIRESAKTVANGGLTAFEFCFDSPYVAVGDDVYDYAAVSLRPGRPILDAVMDLTGRICREFEYRGGVSDVSTPVRARYVSGYLLTHPPEGKEKLIGADASHAWISVWSGADGWVDFDPTNNVIPKTEHITVGWGRDYGDVSPINGFILGGGAHQVVVAVDVTQLMPAPG